MSRFSLAKITHPDREVWPGIRKIDLARYYETVGERLLAHIRDRRLTLVRCPDGALAQCFFQRHLKGRKDYFSLNTVEQVLEAVQNGAVEFHTWGATEPRTDRPDRITLDLDPGPGVSKSRRRGKVFVDYLRNGDTASAVAAWSARARPGATVSMPVEWKALGDADLRGRFTVRTAARRADPWKDYGRTRQRISEKMRRALGG